MGLFGFFLGWFYHWLCILIRLNCFFIWSEFNRRWWIYFLWGCYLLNYFKYDNAWRSVYIESKFCSYAHSPIIIFDAKSDMKSFGDRNNNCKIIPSGSFLFKINRLCPIGAFYCHRSLVKTMQFYCKTLVRSTMPLVFDLCAW